MANTRIVSLKDFEDYAARTLPVSEWGYINTGGGAGVTQLRNEKCFREYLIRPRVMYPVGIPDLSTSLLGQQVSMPICVGPTASHGIAHESGEIGTAGAAYKSKTVYCMSNMSTTPIQDVSKANASGIRWFQLYQLGATQTELIKRIRVVEDHGYTAIALTVDVPVYGIRYADERNNFSLPSHLELAFHVGGKTTFKGEKGSGLSGFTTGGSIGWDFLDWLISITRLPIVVKGICTPEDAILAVKHGASAVWVSNHGGRHLDAVPGSLDLLCDVMRGLERVGSRVEVYMDGGVRYGTDVLKALALGARAVFIGQPVIWGLCYKGEEGVHMVLELLREELRLAMILAGCKNVHDIAKGLVVHKSEYLNSKL
ncbi:Peroxisomal (S)-2-hydroxy-acid oxidase GLO5 [Oopsacas minuta]|uniref:(S)-2-hydroxy-acid oxidase n=1 Tax=Oopsacas minuta TaxID=111878 RepID=A0AAV7JXE8_9METZ|nr:Peroxisomal (S)-2-hydroxy-acid oxidase GLO5 [Oopsacas minuta]